MTRPLLGFLNYFSPVTEIHEHLRKNQQLVYSNSKNKSLSNFWHIFQNHFKWKLVN